MKERVEIKFGIDKPKQYEFHDYWLKVSIHRKRYDTWIRVTKKWVGFHKVARLGATRKDYGFIEIVTLENIPGNQL
jgi:hypothetical protein